MPLPRLEPGTSGKRWMLVANWATPIDVGVASRLCCGKVGALFSEVKVHNKLN
ncbi:hypothetical protein Hanom_Chr10g00909391 [Helianthus anomalus]